MVIIHNKLNYSNSSNKCKLNLNSRTINKFQFNIKLWDLNQVVLKTDQVRCSLILDLIKPLLFQLKDQLCQLQFQMPDSTTKVHQPNSTTKVLQPATDQLQVVSTQVRFKTKHLFKTNSQIACQESSSIAQLQIKEEDTKPSDLHLWSTELHHYKLQCNKLLHQLKDLHKVDHLRTWIWEDKLHQWWEIQVVQEEIKEFHHQDSSRSLLHHQWVVTKAVHQWAVHQWEMPCKVVHHPNQLHQWAHQKAQALDLAPWWVAVVEAPLQQPTPTWTLPRSLAASETSWHNSNKLSKTKKFQMILAKSSMSCLRDLITIN